MKVETIHLPSPAPGTQRSLQVLRFGEDRARPKAYLQAALHADEIPPLLVLHKLVQLLEQAERDDAVTGEVVVVPAANPIGSDQYLFGFHQGRYAQGSGLNFNRGYLNLVEAVASRVARDLSNDAGSNVTLIRNAALRELDQIPIAEDAALRHTLLRLAIDADIVIDMHCDAEAILHVYLANALWPDAEDLPAWLGSLVTLLADESGGDPFDEACSGLWWGLARRFPQYPIPSPCLASTVEFRGLCDVDEMTAETDARNLLNFLQGRGVLRGDVGRPPELSNRATPFEGVAMVTAPHAGIVSYQVNPGTVLQQGDLVAVLIDPLEREPNAARTEIDAPVSGIMFARRSSRLARPGQILCKIAGAEAIAERIGTYLLSD